MASKTRNLRTTRSSVVEKRKTNTTISRRMYEETQNENPEPQATRRTARSQYQGGTSICSKVPHEHREGRRAVGRGVRAYGDHQARRREAERHERHELPAGLHRPCRTERRHGIHRRAAGRIERRRLSIRAPRPHAPWIGAEKTAARQKVIWHKSQRRRPSCTTHRLKTRAPIRRVKPRSPVRWWASCVTSFRLGGKCRSRSQVTRTASRRRCSSSNCTGRSRR